MSADHDRARDDEPGSRPLAQAGSAVASLAEAWLRDSVYCGVGLLALVTVVCGVAASDRVGIAVLGVVAGLACFAIPTVAVVRRPSASRVWLALLAGAVMGGAGLALVLTS
ncbi:hypothetical protein ACFQ3F_19290 [Nocardioides ginsengisoli]|uniref:DUF2537 domain-containing protein n=1 Tax=Nocardioides ginsengisoli TaxID=363868 RepID=A0ABW3W5W2_9ACTN